MPFLQSIFFCFFSSKKKRRRFAFEPSVLCSALGKTAGAQGGNCSADDFLLRGRFARESRRAGAADTGRDKAEEGGIPAAVFRPTTTQDVPASVRLRGCASRASRPFFSSKKKRRAGRVVNAEWSHAPLDRRASRPRRSRNASAGARRIPRSRCRRPCRSFRPH